MKMMGVYFIVNFYSGVEGQNYFGNLSDTSQNTTINKALG